MCGLMDKFKKAYLNEALRGIGFTSLTEVQETVIPKILKGNDVIVEAKTGSGKTHAYLLPILERLDESSQTLQAMIIAPTAELARQIHLFLRDLIAFSQEKIDVRLFVGGSNRQDEIDQLQKSQPQIAIGTPGKLHDLTRQKNVLKSFQVRTLVIDEADMTFEEGYLLQVDQVAATMGKNLQTLVFSATIPVQIQPFLNKYLRNPIVFSIHSPKDHNLQIKHYFVKSKEVAKETVLIKLLKTFQPYLCLIFCNTLKNSEAVYAELKSLNYNVVLFNGDLPPRNRKQIIDRLHNLEYQYVVATDILSRGIDIDNISHIINFDLPKDPHFYIHRSGRTGRMASEGVAISIYDFADNTYIDVLEKLGIHCEYRQIIKNELVEQKDRLVRSKRERPESAIAKTISQRTPRPKAVKPGYKVKRKDAIAKKVKQLNKKGGRQS
jgi:ATP-dependent RNA helicase CshB